MSPPLSPGLLLPPPTRGKGVRRLNRMPAYALIGVVGVAGLTAAYVGLSRRQQAVDQQAAEAANHQTKGAGADAAAFFDGPAPQTPPRRQQPPPNASPAPGGSPSTVQQSAQAQPSPAEEARTRAWQAYYQQVAQLEQAKTDAASQALTAGTDATTDSPPGNAPGLTPGMLGIPAVPQSGATPQSGFPVAGTDAGAQAEKRAFLAQDGDPLGVKEDLLAVKHGPKLDAIMQGTALPGIMIGGMSSDMPGMIVGQVAENIYDTATGQDLLIPQGSRVIGTYDNSVSAGQERIGVIWNRIIFPDTSSIQLGSMEGADQGGYAGFHDQVNTHFWAKFGNALLISIAGAGIQLSQPQATNGQNYSPTSIGSASLGQQFGQLGQEYARAGMAIPNRFCQ